MYEMNELDQVSRDCVRHFTQKSAGFFPLRQRIHKVFSINVFTC